jgi:hypothetical protein
MQGDQGAHHGRGATSNPPNRFTPLWHVRDPDWTDPEEPAPMTQFFTDTARSILTSNASPDVGFTRGINPYRECEHGCISGVFLRGSCGQRSDPRRAWYGKFAGILQVEIRQRVPRVRMLMLVSCEGSCGHAWRGPRAQSAGEETPKDLPRTL